MRFEIDPSQVRPYYDSLGDGLVQLSFTLPLQAGPQAEAAARQMMKRMNLSDVSVVEQKSLAPGFAFFVVYARCAFSIDARQLPAEAQRADLTHDEVIRLSGKGIGRRLVVVGATLESDAHTVGLDAIFNQKGFAGHPGLEHYRCFRTVNLGAQAPYRVVVDALRREEGDALLISQTITQKGFHLRNLTRMLDVLEAEGLRQGLILVVGGPSITPELAKELGYDAGFGKGTVPERVAAFLVREYLRRKDGESNGAHPGENGS